MTKIYPNLILTGQNSVILGFILELAVESESLKVGKSLKIGKNRIKLENQKLGIRLLLDFSKSDSTALVPTDV